MSIRPKAIHATMSTVAESPTRENALANLGRKPLFQEIQRHIRTYIFARGLKPGEMLPPAPEMATYLGVSLASLREGLRAMEALGMLETRHGIGTFVRTYNLTAVFESLSFNLLFDADGLYKMTQIRESMEVGLLREVVASISDDELAKLDEIFQRTQNFDWTADCDRPFHRLIYTCLNNELIAQVLDIYWMASAALIDTAFFTDSDRRDNWHDHHNVYLALAARDPEAAIDAMRKHFARSKARMRPMLSEASNTSTSQSNS
jgi:DNA-binding FadR family transcriptional regulator